MKRRLLQIIHCSLRIGRIEICSDFFTIFLYNRSSTDKNLEENAFLYCYHYFFSCFHCRCKQCDNPIIAPGFSSEGFKKFFCSYIYPEVDNFPPILLRSSLPQDFLPNIVKITRYRYNNDFPFLFVSPDWKWLQMSHCTVHRFCCHQHCGT